MFYFIASHPQLLGTRVPGLKSRFFCVSAQKHVPSAASIDQFAYLQQDKTSAHTQGGFYFAGSVLMRYTISFCTDN